MTKSKKTIITILIILGGLIIILLSIRAWQLFRAAQFGQQSRQQDTQLAIDRQSADRLLQRLEAATQLRSELAMPQVQLNIKL